MVDRRVLGRIAGGITRVLALIALLLGLFSFQPGEGVSFLNREDATASSAPAVQNGPDIPYYLPVIAFNRDDLFAAESNLLVTAVSAGYAHACALRPDGQAVCWGLNDDGQATVPAGTYTQISAGGSHTCAVQPGGSLACWGDNTYGQSTVPAGMYALVSAGGQHTCAIRADGTLACWGSNALGQLTGIPGGAFEQLSAGNAHTCAARADGTLACWGSNNYGQASTPAGSFTQVSAGGFHSCAVSAAGLTCWGANDAGQITVPAGDYAAVAAGYLHTCALTAGGSPVCWGSNGFGQLNELPAGEFTQISASGNHTCALRPGGTLACWGWNRYGQSFPPSGVEVSAGQQHACAILPDGLVSCWGDNTYGQSTPPAGSFQRISAGDLHTCGVERDGSLACWGDNRAGQSAAPAGAHLDVSAGGQHSCALTPDGTLTCWGANASGQSTPPSGTYRRLDAGSLHNCALDLNGALSCWGANASGQSTPPAGTFTQVSAGGRHSCAINVQGVISCWGDNAQGQTASPTGTFAEVSAGAEHTCGVSALGLLFCWGDNTYGQSSPPEGSFVHVSAGARDTCAVRLDGTVTCWGGSAVTPVIELSPETLPDAVLGQPYSAAFSASGGEAPYTFTVSEGALPAGLSLSSEGLLSGTPEAAGTFTFTVQAADSSRPMAAGQRQYDLTVREAQPGDTTPPVITPSVSGTPGNNGWYVSGVTVTWEVTDPESPVSATSGCEETTLTEDTPGQTLTCTATSAGGTSSESVTVKIDQTAPVDVRGVPDREPDYEGWYNKPVTVTFTGQDATSGIASCTETTYTGPDNPAASVTGTCTDNAGNTSQPAVFTFQYDAIHPKLHPEVMPNPVYLHGKAKVIPNASDGGSGLLRVSCDEVDTSSVGLKKVECRAKDQAGNYVSAAAEYNVIYKFVGYLPPVLHPPMINRVKAGQSVPFKFYLLDAYGKPVTEDVSISFRVEPFKRGADAEITDIEEIYLDRFGFFHLGRGLYHYNWKTSKEYAGQLVKTVIDLGEGPGFEHVAFFWFKK